MMEIPNEKYAYFAYGMKRGGHHAVINWVLGHFDSWLYCNNCVCKKDRICVQYDSDIRTKGNQPYETALLSFEDRPNFLESSFESILRINKKPTKNILILRDVYNTFASRFRKKRFPHINGWGDTWTNFDDVSIWKKYALEFLGETCIIGDSVKINYNKWFANREYRKKISSNFGEFTDSGLEDVLDFGLGSSFEYMEFHGKAQQMDVEARWKEFYNDKEYIDCLTSDKEIEELNREIFGFSIPKFYL